MMRLNAIDDKRTWNNVVHGFGATDTYYSYEYCAAAARFENGKPILIYFTGPEGEVVYPIILRRIGMESEGESFDITTPYGYGGPLVKGDAVLADFRTEYLRYCQEKRIITEVIRFHPLLGNAAYMTDHCDTQYIRQTTAVDLQEDLAAIRSKYSKMTKRNIKKAHKNGLVCRRVEKNDRNIQIFLNLYNQTMERRNATDFYYFDSESLEEQLTDSPVSDAHLLFVYNGEEVIAAVILYTCSEYAHYHLGASACDTLHLRPNNLVFDAMVEVSKGAGCRYLHLGGGCAEGDSLFQFKTSYSNNNNYDFYIGKTILNEEKYRQLVRNAERHFILKENFFPEYRGIEEARVEVETPNSA